MFLGMSGCASAQDTVKILFVYGSKPKAKSESKWFGGIHGGHVSVQYHQMYASFVPNGKFHVFSSKKHIHSEFVTESEDRFVFDTADSRYAIISIPVTRQQSNALDSVIAERLKTSPYDYAFLGMRCASAAYELLASAGIMPVMSRHKMVRRYFYPKKLRKQWLKEAALHHWKVFYRPGKTSRKWEKD